MVLLEDLMKEVPPITKVLCGSSIVIHFLIYIEAITKYDIYFNVNLIMSKFQVSGSFNF